MCLGFRKVEKAGVSYPGEEQGQDWGQEAKAGSECVCRAPVEERMVRQEEVPHTVHHPGNGRWDSHWEGRASAHQDPAMSVFA